MRYRMTVKYELERYPAMCSECPAFEKHPYSCHNERGEEADCRLGYMKGRDMRDFTGLFDRFCNDGIIHNENVSIIPKTELMIEDTKRRVCESCKNVFSEDACEPPECLILKAVEAGLAE